MNAQIIAGIAAIHALSKDSPTQSKGLLLDEIAAISGELLEVAGERAESDQVPYMASVTTNEELGHRNNAPWGTDGRTTAKTSLGKGGDSPVGASPLEQFAGERADSPEEFALPRTAMTSPAIHSGNTISELQSAVESAEKGRN